MFASFVALVICRSRMLEGSCHSYQLYCMIEGQRNYSTVVLVFVSKSCQNLFSDHSLFFIDDEHRHLFVFKPYRTQQTGVMGGNNQMEDKAQKRTR